MIRIHFGQRSSNNIQPEERIEVIDILATWNYASDH